MLYLSEEDVQKTLTVVEAIKLAEQGITADSKGDVEGDKFYMPVNDKGFIKLFSGYIKGEEILFSKIFSFFPKNPERFGLPTTCSHVLLQDARTGFSICLMEANWVTGIRTCASTAVTAKWLANPLSENLVIFGAGLLGRLHLESLASKFPLKKVCVLDILPNVAEKYASEMMEKFNFEVEAVRLDDRERAVREADMVVTVTTGNQPLIEREWLMPGTFIAKLGSYQELALDVITEADKVIVDRWKYAGSRVPELIRLAEEGRFNRDDVYAEWPEVFGGKRPGRESPSEIIVYIALGIWGEYAAILPAVYRRAQQLGIGKSLG